MDRPFDIIVAVWTITETIAKSATAFRKLRCFFLLGDMAPTISVEGTNEAGHIDLGYGYLPAKLDDLFQELFNIL